MATMTKEVLVYISLDGVDIQVGNLWFNYSKGRERATFQYDTKWLQHPEKFALEPALTLTEGTFHTHAGMRIFGAIGDSAPDRWGRVLMRRGERQRADAENKMPRTLFEADYLLGVNDEARQGALRFAFEPEKFLAELHEKAIPLIIDLPKLLTVTEHFIENNESADELKLLLAPGSSLGGARPKASIREKDGSLAIAKFPRKDDEYNVVVWEAVALTLAKNAGITLPSWRLETILGKPVLIIKRFDRDGQIRKPYLSAMSMLGAQDHEPHSYLELAYILAQNGAAPDHDMAELWRRIVFTVLISNTDDHLRNHGFLYQSCEGWQLSPAYDLNPTPTDIKPRMLSMAINMDDNSASLNTAMSVISDFRLTKPQANAIIQEVAQAVSQWRKVAADFGLSSPEMNRMRSAFEHQDLALAIRI